MTTTVPVRGKKGSLRNRFKDFNIDVNNQKVQKPVEEIKT